jgi:ABC-type multidrug transport system ATPase subunit
VNGAGKTTCLQIIIGELSKTCGEAYLSGQKIGQIKNILFNWRTKNRNSVVGYCPQFDYLPDYLTVKQTLDVFARLRGVPKSIREETINEFVDVFRLEEFKNKLVQTLSGGNKRKLSSAIAFIGNPSVVILDEVDEKKKEKTQFKFFCHSFNT